MKKKLFLLFFNVLFLLAAGGAEAALIYNPATSAYILLSDYYLEPGDSFSVSGKMFGPFESVLVSVGEEKKIVFTDYKGEFRVGSLFIPDFAVGENILVSSLGLRSGVERRAEISIRSYQPFVKPQSYYVRPGAMVIFGGRDFMPQESVSVFLNGRLIDRLFTDSDGSFRAESYRLPLSAKNQIYDFRGNSSGGHFSVTITPALYP